MNFKYKVNKRPYEDGNKSPSIPISLKGDGNNSFQFIGLLDSGADYSVIPQDVAELLGLGLKGNGLENPIELNSAILSYLSEAPTVITFFKHPGQLIVEYILG